MSLNFPKKEKSLLESNVNVLGYSESVNDIYNPNLLELMLQEDCDWSKYKDIINITKINIQQTMKEFSEVMQKIPLDYEILKCKGIELIKSKNSIRKPIDKKIIHKKLNSSVIISKESKIGNMYFFNIFENSGEFKFDHPSDHVQGMLLMEGIRQASIASVHLAGLENTGRITLLSFNVNFSNYVEKGYPVIIRTFPLLPVKKGIHDCELTFVISQIFQKGRLCGEAFLAGQVFSSKENYEALRLRTIHVMQRYEKQFEKQIANLD